MSIVAIADDGGDTVVTTSFGEIIAPSFAPPEIGKQIFEKIPDLPVRDDDVMLCTFMKTGTNWMFEILTMILQKSAERSNNSSKLFTMIDTVHSEYLDTRPSPRILNSHFTPRYLPRGLKTKKTKTIMCMRNPKDTCVSTFHHIKCLKPYNYNGKWENFVRPWLQGKFEYGAYTTYLNEWQTAIEEGPGFPLLVIYYEDMKLNGMAELNRLLKFLELEIDETLKSDILEMCHIDKMKGKVSYPEEFAKLVKLNSEQFKGHLCTMNSDLKDLDMPKAKPKDFISAFITGDNFTFYRKGLIGDWKNVFTVAQNELFDEIWNRNIRRDTIFTFQYS